MLKGEVLAMWPEFGKWIKERREQLRRTQIYVAKKADIDRQQYYRIEAGKSGTRRETVLAIADALELDHDEALTKAGYAPSKVQTFKRPENLEDFLGILQSLGVGVMPFEGLSHATSPEFFEAFLDDLSNFIHFKLMTPPSRTFSLEVGIHPDDLDRSDAPQIERRRADVSPPAPARFPDRRKSG